MLIEIWYGIITTYFNLGKRLGFIHLDSGTNSSDLDRPETPYSIKKLMKLLCILSPKKILGIY